ncbi:hypothetical protein THIOKS1740003 [Thiocapsa sp. KS1]|nr:hypothetical protein THIOKS1740003 [Thiocapsa sp. KS1]
MGMVGETLALGLHVLRRQTQARAGTLVEDLLDPARDPGQLRKPADLVRAVREGEGRTRADIGLRRGQIAQVFGIGQQIGVDGEGQPMGVIGRGRLLRGEGQEAQPCPGLGSRREAPRRVQAQYGHRQPDAVEQACRIVDRHAQLRLQRNARTVGPVELIGALVVEQTRERAVALLHHELARQGLAQREGQAEVEELNAAVGDQRHLGFEIHQSREHGLKPKPRLARNAMFLDGVGLGGLDDRWSRRGLIY